MTYRQDHKPQGSPTRRAVGGRLQRDDGWDDWVPLPRRQVMITMGGVMMAIFLASLDQTIIATAIPHIVTDLGGFDRFAWVTTAYLVASTAVIPIVGKLSDIYGRKVFFIGGIIIFVVGLCARGCLPGYESAHRLPSPSRTGRRSGYGQFIYLDRRPFPACRARQVHGLCRRHLRSFVRRWPGGGRPAHRRPLLEVGVFCQCSPGSADRDCIRKGLPQPAAQARPKSRASTMPASYFC